MDWNNYYKNIEGRPPRELLVEALKYAPKGVVLDVGAGDLVDSKYLLEQGYKVVAVDGASPSHERSKAISKRNFSFKPIPIEDFNAAPKKYDVVSAQYSLPFVDPEKLGSVLHMLKKSLKDEGVFVAQFFGYKDSWNDGDGQMSFCNLAQLGYLFGDFKIHKLEEVEEDSPQANGEMKHWHRFDLIAQNVA